MAITQKQINESTAKVEKLKAAHEKAHAEHARLTRQFLREQRLARLQAELDESADE